VANAIAPALMIPTKRSIEFPAVPDYQAVSVIAEKFGGGQPD
jgi:hypothetical protein